MLTFRVLSALLSYPTPELRAAAESAKDILRREGLLDFAQRDNVCAFIDQLRCTTQLEAESSYIDAFDHGRSTSLYLFEHIHGESRDRGQAMVRLLARYRMHGLELNARELPDFLPLFLEFLSICRPNESRRYLSEVGDIICLLGRRLRNRNAPHSVLLEAIASLTDFGEQNNFSEDADFRDDQPAALDSAWEEAPVTFDDATLGSVERLAK